MSQVEIEFDCEQLHSVNLRQLAGKIKPFLTGVKIQYKSENSDELKEFDYELIRICEYVEKEVKFKDRIEKERKFVIRIENPFTNKVHFLLLSDDKDYTIDCFTSWNGIKGLEMDSNKLVKITLRAQNSL